ncbi:hypothetical protein HNR19_004047 [Nocardioides thalensis]|uniref:Uncharacterized protein n=1 Tax=Nocardioides thalensis TaxID=1914755 RepID=A0A853C801_9ACTN|nr:hypothetical protein [Nocardioides thalensis]NYJ03349.1 hypothetical protein [Nocardioides thalensis]
MTARREIEVSAYAAPLVRRVAVRLADSIGSDDLASLIDELPGQVTLGSAPTEACVVESGERVVRVRSADRHEAPTFVWEGDGTVRALETSTTATADRLATLLAGPERAWADRLSDVWSRGQKAPGLPAAVRFRCTDDGSELVLGEGEPEVEVTGSEVALHGYARGDLPLLLSVLGDVDLTARGSLAHLSVLQGVGLSWVLGTAALPGVNVVGRVDRG